MRNFRDFITEYSWNKDSFDIPPEREPTKVWSRKPYIEPKMPEEGSSIILPIPYSVYQIFQNYSHGPNDPLYVVLSRRGNSVDWKNVKVTTEELKRLKEVAQQILQNSDDPVETRTAKAFLDNVQFMK